MVDLTLQWNGRRKANSNEIDPAFCRVLFYLELETLQETFVDMQVQNRIITITVMNENQNLSMLAKPLISKFERRARFIELYFIKCTFYEFIKGSRKKVSNTIK